MTRDYGRDWLYVTKVAWLPRGSRRAPGVANRPEKQVEATFGELETEFSCNYITQNSNLSSRAINSPANPPGAGLLPTYSGHEKVIPVLESPGFRFRALAAR